MKRKCSIAADRMEELIRSGEWPVGSIAPTVRALAASLQVSPVTVMQALEELSGRGGVTREGGDRRYRVAGRFSTATVKAGVAPPQARRHEQIAGILKEEILSGRLSNEIPTGSAVSAKFGCSRATARAALALLAEMGYIDLVGRRVAAPGTGPAGAHESTVFMTGHPGIPLAYSMHVLLLVQTLERELAGLGWRPLRYLLSRAPSSGPQAPPEHTVTAFIHLLQFDFEDQWVPFFRGYARVPVVVVDMEESDRPLPKHLGSGTLKLTPDNRHAGRSLAGHLHGLGHRGVALISHIPVQVPWVQRRIEGCSEVLRHAASSDANGLHVLCLPEQPGDPPGEDPVPRQRIDSIQWQLINAGRLPGDAVRTKVKGTYDLYFQDRTARRMAPVFEEAYRSGSTAWVCINDEIACQALTFLEKKGSDGRRVAIAGFDNSPESYRLGITTYDFAFDRIGSLAIRSVAYPDQANRRSLITRQISGQLIARQSTLARHA